MKPMVSQASDSMTSIKLSSVGLLIVVFGWALAAQLGFSLALTVCELRALFFVSSQYVYKFDCVPVSIHRRSLGESVAFFMV